MAEFDSLVQAREPIRALFRGWLAENPHEIGVKGDRHYLVCALNWIENMRALRRHTTETVGRASALTAQAAALGKEVLRLARLVAAEGESEAAAAARKVAYRAGLALA